MARLRIASGPARPLRLPSDARNSHAPEGARVLVQIEIIVPMHRTHQTSEFFAIGRKSGQPFTNQLAPPPPFFAQGSKPIPIKPCPNVMRRFIWKRIVGEQ